MWGGRTETMTKSKSAAVPMGNGIVIEMDGTVAEFRIDLTGNYGTTGKGFRQIASSLGNKGVPGVGRGLMVGLNCYNRDAARDFKASDFPTDWANEYFGRNVTARIDSGVLILRVDTGADFGETKLGKSISVASSGGNQMLPLGIELGINVYDPIPKGEWSDETIEKDRLAKLERARKNLARLEGTA
jgi:hypothetical protein